MQARTIAQRLSVSQEAVDRLQRRGFLLHLDLDEAEIRERLWRAHRTAQEAPADRPTQTGDRR
jgi:hypothetical protein